MTQCPKRLAAFLFVVGALVLALPAMAAAQPYVYPARGQSPQQQEYAAQQQNAMSQGHCHYNQAFGACMKGRGYTVI